jgi:hypothetical protein
VRRLALAALIAFVVRSTFAQGGPPMITDDPGTPGDGKWEINLAIAFEHRPRETSYDLPAIDLNCGVGEHIQLTLQTAPVLLKRSGHGAIGGIGSTEAAVKWRFVDEEANGADISMFPRIIFNVVQSSMRRGLSGEGTVSRSQCRWRRSSVHRMWTRSSARSPALLAEANGFTELLAELT